MTEVILLYISNPNFSAFLKNIIVFRNLCCSIHLEGLDYAFYTSEFHNYTSWVCTVLRYEMTLLSLKSLKIYVNHNKRVFLVRNDLALRQTLIIFYYSVQKLFCIETAQGRGENENNLYSDYLSRSIC